MANAPRIPAELVRRKMTSGEDTLVVCAYPNDEQCAAIRIPGSITFRELEARRPTLRPTQEIVFY
ncbi:MAG TPA: ArsR family transcriptional regulator [Planctomycetota bacterium]|nr:ArsR family transcriptional regulator [Planctomycetota bacterium]